MENIKFNIFYILERRGIVAFWKYEQLCSKRCYVLFQTKELVEFNFFRSLSL